MCVCVHVHVSACVCLIPFILLEQVAYLNDANIIAKTLKNLCYNRTYNMNNMLL